jgi:hypothetical protein
LLRTAMSAANGFVMGDAGGWLTYRRKRDAIRAQFFRQGNRDPTIDASARDERHTSTRRTSVAKEHVR